MKTVSMSGSPRESVGKKDARKARAQGKIPCVMYGGDEQLHFVMEEKDFEKLVFTPNVYIVNLTIEGKEYQTIVQDVQYHPVTDKVLHADFLQVLSDKPIKLALPVWLNGTAIGVTRGGRLIQNKRKLRVEGLISDLPDAIEIDITDMKIGDIIKIEDMKYEKLNFLDVHSELIVAVRAARKIEEELVEEEEEEGEEGEEGEVAAEGGEASAAEEKSE
ncbi:MAG: 50S ribosomal protein L25/general stress protein Ctc [Bacteroidales bacterium]|nr:50S ribosomal protein L25/general stress protein Ctc [Bacteroidales bacterium]MCF8344862.1 50S ribosomal protein L25/general stress protein Ctc [Bacteroidales bacterium]MCF8349958.1 50S ribosomal protein L25/general stress protein Ctc [Bacteroidales bacterium]MCF8376700.1 50S ribosomal protein L25/general stress protein Ctc [Bacteroidales bacterium]